MANKTKNIKCPNFTEKCDADVKLEWEDGHWNGECPKCGVDVGRIETRKLYRAMENPPDPEADKKKKKSDWDLTE